MTYVWSCHVLLLELCMCVCVYVCMCMCVCACVILYVWFQMAGVQVMQVELIVVLHWQMGVDVIIFIALYSSYVTSCYP